MASVITPAMTSAMEDVGYKNRNFNYDPTQHRHPLWMTEKHFAYHLAKDRLGQLACIKDRRGERIRSPRCLSDICVYSLVCSDAKVLQVTSNRYWPVNLYPRMLTEALYQREAQAIVWIISTWPMKTLRLIDLVPLEDDLDPEYLTLPIEDNEDNCLVDFIILGLLKTKPEAGLKTIDFTGFDKDRKLCRELCRLPFLWIKKSERTAENIHEKVSDIIDVSKDKVQRFLNRIDCVYSNIEKEFKHRNKMDVITIVLDLHISIDDVPLGLTLQKHTPFRFICRRLWVKHIPEVSLPPDKLDRVLELGRVTHFTFNDALLPRDSTLFTSLCACLESLTNLTGFSLPGSLDVQTNPSMATTLNKVLIKLKHLQRIDLSYCTLRGKLSELLGGMRQRLSYLNLRDCRLEREDVDFLARQGWRPLGSLRELNLSCNMLGDWGEPLIMEMLDTMKHLTCLSLKNCQLSVHSLALIMRQCKECDHLKVLCVQMYIPLSRDDTFELLSIAAHMRTLQRVMVYPDAYAFPGHNEAERKLNRWHFQRWCYRYLAAKGRPDLRLH